MAKTKPQLLLRIEQGDNVIQRRLNGNEKLSIGQDPKSDIIIYGEQFPKKHDLITGHGGQFTIYLKSVVKGEVIAGNSRLSFHDMLAHNLLSRKGDSFIYPVTLGKKGILQIGDATITFQCAEVQRKEIRAEKKIDFSGYSWTYVTLSRLKKDLPFKAIFACVTIFFVLSLKYLSGITADFTPKITPRDIVPERLAKIIVKNPESLLTDESVATIGTGAEEEGEEDVEAKGKKGRRGEKGDRNVRPENQGVLGLLTGTGSSSQSNNLADFLLDKGLARELDEVIGATDLLIGLGNGKSTNDDLDNLIATSEIGGGIDDILSGIDDVETVSLGKKGRIQVDKIGGMSGNENALGKRTEESVRQVMLSYTGRLTYIYNKYLKRNPNLSGKLVVEVVIAASGDVSSVKLVSSNVNLPEFEREILSFVRRWKYDPIDQGSVTVSYPLFFNKVG